MSWLWKHTPVVHYDIIDERRADYDTNPGSDYFRSAAERTAAFCNRTSSHPESLLTPLRKIRWIWFQSNDDQVKILFDLDCSDIDMSVGIVNRLGDRHVAQERAGGQQAARLEEIRTRVARAKELRDAQERAARDLAAAGEKLFFDRKDLQLARLGAAVSAENSTFVADVRTNPYHYRKLGLAIVRTQFNKMVSDKLALFGNGLAPVFVHLKDVDRFTRSGETVMLAFKVIERGEVERTYGSLPEIVISALASGVRPLSARGRHVCRAIAPSAANLQNVDDAGDDPAIVEPLRTRLVPWQMRLDRRPLHFGQPKQSAHDPSRRWRSESRSPRPLKRMIEFGPSVLSH